jgi:hypothetical protein
MVYTIAPNGIPSQPRFGSITSTNDARPVQLTGNLVLSLQTGDVVSLRNSGNTTDSLIGNYESATPVVATLLVTRL